jgi:hypothetical protein
MPDSLDLDYVDRDIPRWERVREFIIREWPTKEVTVFRRAMRVQSGAHKRLKAVREDVGLGPDDLPASITDVVAIWTGVLYRRCSQ